MTPLINELYKKELQNMKEIDILENTKFTSDINKNIAKSILEIRKEIQKEINTQLEYEFRKALE